MSKHPKLTISLLCIEHDLSDFVCGDESMDLWLKSRALKNQKSDATRTFVVTTTENCSVIAYYGLSMSEIIRSNAPKPVQRNMPQSTPVVLLGRLAIHKDYQGRGLGRYLMRHVIKTSVKASEVVAARMLITQPIDKSARLFYQAIGLDELPNNPDLLGIDLKKTLDLLS